MQRPSGMEWEENISLTQNIPEILPVLRSSNSWMQMLQTSWTPPKLMHIKAGTTFVHGARTGSHSPALTALAPMAALSTSYQSKKKSVRASERNKRNRNF